MYVMYARNEIAHAIVEHTKESSYRDLSTVINICHPNHKISPSKLCRIANQKQDLTGKDIEILINVLKIPIDRIFVTMPF